MAFLFALLVSAQAGGYARPELLVDTTWLAQHLNDPAVRIVTRLVDCDVDALRIDLPVRVVFQPLAFAGDDRRVVAPFFTPAR